MRPELVPPPESFSCLPRRSAEVGAGARAVLEEARLVLDELVDAHQVVVDRLDEARRALRALVGASAVSRHRVGSSTSQAPVAARALDAVAVEEAAVEPHRRVEGAELVDEQVRELGLEGVGVFLRREVAAEALAGLADGVREAVDDLADARLAELFLAVEAGLAEVLGDDDVGRELRPAGGDLGALHLEDDRAVGVGDDAGAALPHHAVERIAPGRREEPGDGAAAAARGGRLLVVAFASDGARREGRLGRWLGTSRVGGRDFIGVLAFACGRSLTPCDTRDPPAPGLPFTLPPSPTIVGCAM